MVRFVRFLCSGSGSLAPSRRLGSESDVEDEDGDGDGDVKDEDEDGDVEDEDEDVEDVELPIALLSHEVPTSCPNLCDRCLFYER